ncbi:MAG TPA: hypothetical protein VGW38_13810, partial [Chloroflexota bacterium]|nr:hypothetical protein [Chloroflexota bacterium]
MRRDHTGVATLCRWEQVMLPVATGHDEAQAWVEAHAAARDVLLTHLVAELRRDERFVAAWFIGSFGRDDQPPDALSDINVVAVVAPSYAAALCARPRQTAGQTTPERLALFRRFGSPAVIHENHHNAPPGGTMSYIVYDTGAELAVYLVPQEGAERPLPSRLLFDRVGVPLKTAPPPETLEERQAQATASVAFFWMMAGITARYRLRGWDSRVNHFLDMLRAHVDTVRRLVAGEPRRYRRRPLLPLAATPAAQAILIRQLCDEMEALMPTVVQLGGQVPPNPRAAIEQRLATTLQGQSMGEPRLVG